CLVPEATRTAKHCLYNHPLSTTKLRDYAQVSRSRSYAYRKTLPIQSSPIHNKTERLRPEAMRNAKHCHYNHPLSTTKLRDYAQVSCSRSYAYRQTLPLESSPVHNETGRLQLVLSFKNLYGPQNTASTIIPFEDENFLYLPSGLLWVYQPTKIATPLAYKIEGGNQNIRSENPCQIEQVSLY
ncbi:hypothetical protein J6590_021410, partial [Homalodisca vitripennis]